MSEETFTVESLIEANNILQDEVTRLRDSNRLLRNVNRAIRNSNISLHNQNEMAKANDDLFKRFCGGEFDANNQFDSAVAEGENVLVNTEANSRQDSETSSESTRS